MPDPPLGRGGNQIFRARVGVETGFIRPGGVAGSTGTTAYYWRSPPACAPQATASH